MIEIQATWKCSDVMLAVDASRVAGPGSQWPLTMYNTWLAEEPLVNTVIWEAQCDKMGDYRYLHRYTEIAVQGCHNPIIGADNWPHAFPRNKTCFDYCPLGSPQYSYSTYDTFIYYLYIKEVALPVI